MWGFEMGKRINTHKPQKHAKIRRISVFDELGTVAVWVRSQGQLTQTVGRMRAYFDGAEITEATKLWPIKN
jgi:hypothetical protein